MTAFVTGATGFVGAHVARALLASGRRVRCLVRPTSDTALLAALAVERVAGDVTDAVSVRQGDGRAATRSSTAPPTTASTPAIPAEIYRTNVEGTRVVLAAAAGAGRAARRPHQLGRDAGAARRRHARRRARRRRARTT